MSSSNHFNIKRKAHHFSRQSDESWNPFRHVGDLPLPYRRDSWEQGNLEKKEEEERREMEKKKKERIKVKMTNQRKKEELRKYAALDALVLPAHVWGFWMAKSGAYEPLKIPIQLAYALPHTFARLNFAQCIPQDGRIELSFDFHWDHRGANRGTKNQSKDFRSIFIEEANLTTIESLDSFWDAIQAFGHFIIWDKPESSGILGPHHYVMYNIGCDDPHGIIHENYDPWFEHKKEERFGYHPMVSHWEMAPQARGQTLYDGTTPCQRIIVCQGLSLVLPVRPSYRYLPFLAMGNEDDPISIAINLHILCQRRASSATTNPYSNLGNGFHITFYEILPQGSPIGVIEMSRQRDLKIGYLYGKPDRNSGNNSGKSNGPPFRESSFTIIPARNFPEKKSDSQSTDSQSTTQGHWTVLILSPSNFFIQPEKMDTDWSVVVHETSLLIAEATIIVDAIRKVEDRWRQLNGYIGSLLIEDFMDPKSYTMLLFDDETFSRSRLYFWITGCLNEFDTSIEDNIKQWKFFRQARIDLQFDLLRSRLEIFGDELITPYHDIEAIQQELNNLRTLDDRGEKVRQQLEELQSQFRAKLATVQTLRDGLFNASALIESRSSTSLGQNVKLLTYVSIVYLPLAFCAALWAVPDISNNDTRNPFIITTFLVGCATYIVVFNLESIVDFLGKFYTGYRSRVLEGMSEDLDSFWQTLRERFEEFPPNDEQRKPSEWWIILYQMQKWLRKTKLKSQ